MKIQVGDKGSTNAKVFLDGKKLKYCIVADEEKGEAVCAVYPLEIDETGEQIKTETLKGIVKVEICR